MSAGSCRSADDDEDEDEDGEEDEDDLRPVRASQIDIFSTQAAIHVRTVRSQAAKYLLEDGDLKVRRLENFGTRH